MFDHLLFVLSLGLVLSFVLAWAFRTLPRERWQILATLPIRKNEAGEWLGVNLTFYGLITASATTFGLALFILLVGALDLSLLLVLTVALATVLGGVIGAKGIAWLVERKKNTFTVAGGAFIGFFVLPLMLWGLNVQRAAIGLDALPILAILAAASISYLFGEGLGRLACISFGCCYGKALDTLRPCTRKLFARLHFTFHGKTKKIAYASQMDGMKVVPIQALTAIAYCLAGLVALWFYLSGAVIAVLIGTTVFAQGWRIFSETLRADYRGSQQFSAYQLMGLASIGYVLLLALWLPSPSPDFIVLRTGFAYLWHPVVLLSLQILWLSLFLYMGWSKVTGAVLSFHVREQEV